MTNEATCLDKPSACNLKPENQPWIKAQPSADTGFVP